MFEFGRNQRSAKFTVVGTMCFACLCSLSSGQTREASRQPFRDLVSWAAAEQAPEPQNNQPGLDPVELEDTTVRQIIHLSVGGTVLRIHLSNAAGTQPLTVDAVSLARPVSARSSAIVPDTAQVVRFGGRETVTVPAGAEYLSDLVSFTAAPLSDLAISFHLPAAPRGQPTHPGAHATSYLVHGAHSADVDLTAAKRQEHWYQLASVDVASVPQAKALICFGDSITDGHGSTTDGNDRWTDVLAARLQANAPTRTVSVANEGIGGNHLLTDGLGENALGRFDRDVLGPSGGAFVLVFEGINDIGTLARGRVAGAAEHAALVARMTAAYQQIIERSHAHGLKVLGVTVTPFMDSDYYKPTAANEADRVAVNQWIRAAGHFDAVIDFDAVVRDPSHPDHLMQGADSGDHLHPSPLGYRKMGEAVPLSLFQ